MADIKFSCSQCGQHITCDEPWAGHQIQCPTCQNTITVPQAPSPPRAPVAASLVPQPPASRLPKLAAGATQVARSTQPGPSPQRRIPNRPPKTSNPALRYALIAVVLLAVGGAALVYLPGLLSQVQETGNTKTAAPASANSGGGVGPMGEVNGAMDVSDTLDGGSSAPAARPAPRQTRRSAPALGTNRAAGSVTSPRAH
jgi:DNA-directed RNA polymerase subunit RPC12/RpoP